MASRIQGITVTINGDTTGLSKALSSVNKEIKSTQAQLKDVEKLLKLDPGNTELLSQKQRLLADAISETKEKLDTLKAASEQASEALARGEITQEQYDALQREIIATTEALEQLEAQAEKSSTSLEQIAAKGEKLKDLGNKISGVGEKIMPVTAAVVGLGTMAVKTAADFDTGMSKVAAVSGAAGEELEGLRDKAREMGAKTKFSATEAASAMEYMAMAGWKTGDMLDGIEGIMNLAAASGESLATTSDIVTDALTAFGLTAADSGHFADILAAASSNANTNVSMMGETFKYCAPIAGAMGFTAEDTAEAIGLMANAGIKSSQAGTSLRTIMTKLSGDLKISGKELGNVTVQTANADGSMRGLSEILKDCRAAFSKLSESEKTAAAESIAGKNAMSSFLALMNAGEADVNKLSGAIADCGGKSQEMADVMQDNLEGQLTILKSQMQELAISLGEIMIPVVRQVVSAIQGVVNWLNSLDEGTKKTIITVALIAAAIGPVLIVIGKLITAVGAIMTVIPKLALAFSKAQQAFSAFSAALAAHPILAIIAVIAALVAAFIHLWNTNEGFRQFWINLWDSIKNAAVNAWNTITGFLSTAWESIKTTAVSVFASIQGAISSAWEAITTAISTVLSTISEAVSSAFTNMWSGITTAMSAIASAITQGLTGAFDFVRGLASSAFNWGADIINGIVNGIRSCIARVRDAVASVAEAIRSFLHFSVPDEGPLTDFESWMPDFMKGLANGIEKSRSMISDAMANVAGDMVLNPTVEANAGIQRTQTEQANSLGGILSAIETLIGNTGNQQAAAGDIVIPVYVGGNKIDELVVNATQRMNYRSGGH